MRNAQKLNIERGKLIRGQILEFLDLNAPAPINAKMMWHLLDQHNFSITDSELLIYLEYLRGKGYLAITGARLREGHMEEAVISLTPAGTDLLEGNIVADPGIEVL